MLAVIAAVVVVTGLAVAGRMTSAGPLHLTQGMVVGDSMVEMAAGAAGADSEVKFIGYSGKAPRVYGGPPSGRMASDYASAGYPRTVVLNWNGNNPYHYSGTRLVAAYRADIAHDIRWYLSQGVTKVILAAAVPSAFNSGLRQTSVTSPAAAAPGAMLGNYQFNDLYKQLARQFRGKVFYSEAAARAIHPNMTFASTLSGHRCIIDYIHPAPYCATRYAHALGKLATSGSPS